VFAKSAILIPRHAPAGHVAAACLVQAKSTLQPPQGKAAVAGIVNVDTAALAVERRRDIGAEKDHPASVPRML